MFWSNFIHIYQPPTQTPEIVEKVTNESYRKIVKILQTHSSGKLTLNINASLTEQLARYGFDDVINGLKELAQDKRIEFTGSAKYHPILPLIPEDEVRRQIELNTETNQEYFGDVYNPVGFFPPEMCYSRKVAEIVQNMGFKWIIIDEIGYNGKLEQVKNDGIHAEEDLEDFYVFFKEREFSAGLTYGNYPGINEFLNGIGSKINDNFYLLTGTDGEIYGHHRPGQETLLIEAFESNKISTCTISELFKYFAVKESVKPLLSSWSTWEKEMEACTPYPQWDYPENIIHFLQWELAYLAIDTIKEADSRNPKYSMARDLLDKGLHSCQWWWASARPWWSVDMIEKGAEQLFSAIDTIEEDPDTVFKAYKLRDNIVNTAISWHHTGKANILKQKYKEEFSDVSNELTFG